MIDTIQSFFNPHLIEGIRIMFGILIVSGTLCFCGALIFLTCAGCTAIAEIGKVSVELVCECIRGGK